MAAAIPAEELVKAAKALFDGARIVMLFKPPRALRRVGSALRRSIFHVRNVTFAHSQETYWSTSSGNHSELEELAGETEQRLRWQPS